MKKGWEIKTLADICTFENGDRGVNYPSKAKRTSTGIPFINAGHFVDNKSDFTNMDYISRERDNLMGSGKIQKGASLVCLRGSLGKFAGVKNLPEGQIASSLVIVRPSELVSHEYLLAYFESYLCEENIERYRGGAAQPNLSAKSLTQFTIPIPSLPEQQRIVSVLDEAFASIAQAKSNAERNLVNARELFEVVAREIFETKGDDWDEKKVNEVCELKSGTTISTSLERNKGDVLYTKIADMNLPENLVEIHTSSRFVNSDEINQNQIIPEGAIIFPKRGGAIATNKKRKIIKPTIVDLNTMAIIPSKKIDKDFLFYWFQLFDLKDISNGANIPQINHYSFDEIYIPYPKPLAEQRAIVGRLEALSAETGRLEEIYQQKVESLEELKKSVLGKAFEGEL